MTCEKNTFIWRIRSASFCEMYINAAWAKCVTFRVFIPAWIFIRENIQPWYWDIHLLSRMKKRNEWFGETSKPRNRNWKSWDIVNYIKHDIWAKSTNIRSTKIQNFTSGNVVWFVAISVRYESRVICILHMHGSHTFSITVFKTSSYQYIFGSVIKSISIWESEVRLTTCFNIVV